MKTPLPDPPLLKESMDEARFRETARDLAALGTDFDTKRFLRLALAGLDQLTLMQRVRRMAQALQAALPPDYLEALGVLRRFAPRMRSGFATMALPDFVGQYGQGHFEESMQALSEFTGFGTSEFAVREFLRRDTPRALAVMQAWSLDASDAVRRLASEGSRPRLPWSFRLDAIAADPSLAAPILENLRADPSLYVRKSVANHLNDVTKAHPAWVTDRLAAWPLDDARTAWIAKRALRSLVKAGDARALALIGAGEAARVSVEAFSVTPGRISLGQQLKLSIELVSQSPASQRLVVDYRIHYVKKSGATSPKVFKLKELTLAAGERCLIERSQSLRDFTTRVHHAGRHEVEVLVNGACVATGFFDLA